VLLFYFSVENRHPSLPKICMADLSCMPKSVPTPMYDATSVAFVTQPRSTASDEWRPSDAARLDALSGV